MSTTTAPNVVCPPWCAVDKAQHVAELTNLDGGCGHESDAITHPAGIHQDQIGHQVWVSAFTWFDGSPHPDAPSTWIEIGGESYAPDVAEVFAKAILDLVKAARA